MYKPAVGTTQAGVVHFGIDFDRLRSPVTDEGVLSLQPNASVPVWKDHAIVVPPNRMMRQNWLYTNTAGTRNESAFSLFYISTGVTNAGEFWVEYDVTFMSPRLSTLNVPDYHSLLCAFANQDTGGWLKTSNVNGYSSSILGITSENKQPFALSFLPLSINQVFQFSNSSTSYNLEPGLYTIILCVQNTTNVSGQDVEFDPTNSSGVGTVTLLERHQATVALSSVPWEYTTVITLLAEITSTTPVLAFDTAWNTTGGSMQMQASLAISSVQQ
jgi:hypothetical protein